MSKKKNSYAKKATKQALLGSIATDETKGSIKKSALETGRDILIGAVGGGLAGAVLGRASFLVGIAVTGAGHYMGSEGTAAFGVGMMASGGYQAISGTMNGTVEKEGFEGVKERLEAFKEEFKRKLFLDKIPTSTKPAATTKEAATEEATNGMGEVQYFTYPDSSKELQGADDHVLDLTALDRIEKQVAVAAQKYDASKQPISGMESDETGMTDINDRNF
jgi:hypothetical protein